MAYDALGKRCGSAAARVSWVAGIALAALGSVAAADTPDFSGIWYPSQRAVQTPNPAPLTPAAAVVRDSYIAEFGLEDDPGRYCIWPGMPRAVWGAPFPIEVIHRPQDVTIYWEGFGMYRKIYMRDSAPPAPPIPSAMGHSVAHWEGDTLVVETDNLKPYPYMHKLATTSDARVVERLSRVEREVNGRTESFLVNEMVLTDPKLYVEPVHLRAEARLRRDLQMLEYTCSDALWEEYLFERGLELPDIDALPGPVEEKS